MDGANVDDDDDDEDGDDDVDDADGDDDDDDGDDGDDDDAYMISSRMIHDSGNSGHMRDFSFPSIPLPNSHGSQAY